MSTRRKYPRTPHLPWSPGASKDDVYLVDLACFEGRDVIVTEKLDGENTTLYQDHLHARSIDGTHHPSRDWVKGLHARIAHTIPDGFRLCGENLYARHSISYANLTSYFYLFSAWNTENVALSWDDTRKLAGEIGLETPRVLLEGQWDEKATRAIQVDPNSMEGYVVRLTDAFRFEDFGVSVAKWVRTGHVQTDQHWMHAQVVPNGLRKV